MGEGQAGPRSGRPTGQQSEGTHDLQYKLAQGQSVGFYERGRQGGLHGARIFPHKVREWYEVLKDVEDHLLPPEVRGYRDGLREGLGL